MSGPTATRLLARTGLFPTLRQTVTPRCTAFITTRAFSVSAPRPVEPPKKSAGGVLSSLYTAAPTDKTSTSTSPESATKETGAAGGDAVSNMMDLLGDTLAAKAGKTTRSTTEDFGQLASDAPDAIEPYHFHIYSHKHNTHVTVSKPDRGAIISMSTGNLGFKKQRRKTYDAAYQLTAYVLERLKYAGWEKKINRIELVLRGFGQGREAGVKVLMSPEGTRWREKIVRVADATRVKFGGTRSRNPRRL